MKDIDDKAYARQRQRIKRRFERLRPQLGASWWVTHIAYDRYPHPSKPACLADINSDWRYREMTITFYLPQIADLDDDTLDNVIVHEFMHGWVNPMRRRHAKKRHIDLEEQVVTSLTAIRSFIWTEGVREGRRLERAARATKRKPRKRRKKP